MLTVIFLLGMGSTFSIQTVNAELTSNLRAETVDTDTNTSEDFSKITDDTQVQNEPSNFKIQVNRLNEAIQDNHNIIKETEHEMEDVTSQIKQMEKDIASLKAKIDKRHEILRDRMRSYQESGGNVSFLEVLLGSSDFGDFVTRVESVAKVVQADRNLMEQQEVQKKNYEDKLSTLENKYAELAKTKTEYEGMQEHVVNQQEQYMLSKEQVEENETDSMDSLAKMESVPDFTDIAVPTAKEKEYIQTIITSGYKYIGNSVYVFGGGRSEYDINNGRFDCSGFVNWAFKQAGIEVGRTTDEIKNDGQQISQSDIQPGDLVFFDTYKKDGHVGIYIEDGKFIGSQSSTGVAIADMSSGYWQKTFNGRVVRVEE